MLPLSIFWFINLSTNKINLSFYYSTADFHADSPPTTGNLSTVELRSTESSVPGSGPTGLENLNRESLVIESRWP